ncbi:hypothetical protein Dimus_010762 [Dionaea muscipula]
MSEIVEEGEAVAQRDGKGLVVSDDEGRKDEMKEIDWNEGDVTPSVAGKLSARKGRKTLFITGRLRSPSNEILGKYLDVMILPTIRGTRKAIQRLPWRHKLACLSRNMVERDFGAFVTLSGDLTEMLKNTEADLRMVTEENQMLERKNEDLQTELKRVKEGRKKVGEEVASLAARLDGLRVTKMDLKASLELKARENEKMQTKLNKARLALAQGIEMKGPSANPEPLAVVHPTTRSQASLTSEMNVSPQAPATDVPLVPTSETNVTPPPCDVGSDKIE